ncbi:MAG: AMP-dependent synthetase/ligase, partial [Polyangiales bacterium]
MRPFGYHAACDVTRFLELKIAPRAVFDHLDERRSRVRFMVPKKVSEGEPSDWTAVTFGAFARTIRHCALFLSAHGVGNGDRAAIYAGNSVEWIASALAIQAAGGAMVPVYPSSTAEQAAYVIAHSDAKVIFVDGAPLLARLMERWAELGAPRVVLLDDALDPARVHSKLQKEGVAVPSFSAIEPRIVSFSRALSIGAAHDREDPQGFERTMHGVSLEQTAVMLYTSGTTGNPKGVPLTHRNVAVNGRDWLTCNAPLLQEGAVDLLWLPMSHIFGFGEACLGNTLGWTSYLTDPKSVLTMLPEVRPHVFMSVPSVWEKLAMAASDADPAVRRSRLAAVTGGNLAFCLSGGAGLKREVKELFHGCGLLIIEGYGLTETSPTLTLNRPDAFRFDSVGKPLPSVELMLAEDGEILARGPSVFSGYHKDPAATAQAFTDDGWLKTGDVGRFTDDGFLQIIDRKKDILVTAGGKNVPPVNIEQRFADDPFIAHLVVYGDGKRYLVAGVWLNDATVDAHLDAHGAVASEARDAARRALVQQRIDKVNAELASYETIKTFAVMKPALTVDGGLLTPTLKVR